MKLIERVILAVSTRPVLVRDEFFETGQIFNYSGGNSLGNPRFLA
jgi:hypothetical protein